MLHARRFSVHGCACMHDDNLRTSITHAYSHDPLRLATLLLVNALEVLLAAIGSRKARIETCPAVEKAATWKFILGDHSLMSSLLLPMSWPLLAWKRWLSDLCWNEIHSGATTCLTLLV